MTSTRINIFRRDGVKITQLKKSIQGEKKYLLKKCTYCDIVPER